MLDRLLEMLLGGALLIPAMAMPSEIQRWLGEAARSWSPLDGQIMASSVENNASGLPREGFDYCLSISYRYTVEGKRFHGNARVLDDNDPERIIRESVDFKAGESIAIYYNIFQPQKSQLRRPRSVSPAYVLFILALVLFCAIYGALLIIGQAHIDHSNFGW